MSEILKEAIDFIAARCDGASSRDHRGFNGGDAYMGHVLADKPYEQWSSKMKYIAYRMLRKYKGQLMAGGIDYDAIPPVEDPKEAAIKKQIERDKKKFKRVEIEGNNFIISFTYDPTLVEAVKKLPVRKYDGAHKRWIVPNIAENVEPLGNLIQGFAFEIDEYVYLALDEAIERYEANLEASTASEADLEVPGLAMELYPFQKAGVAYAVKNGKVFIADEMGLGKTVQAIATIQKLNAYPAIIVCPASLKFNWEKEWNTWLPDRKVAVWNGKGDPAEVVIINYDMLKKRLDDLQGLKAKAIVLDESHYIKTRKAQRTKAAKSLVKGIEYRFFLTGTPIVNRPIELVSQLEVMGRLNEFGGFWKFAERYCDAHYTRFGLDLSGAMNLDELNERLRGKCFIRREKKEVLKELPDKRKVTVPVDIDNRKDYDQAEMDLIEWVGKNALKDKEFLESIAHLPWKEREEKMGEWQMDAEKRAERAEHLVRIEALKQLTAKGKMKQAKEWISDFIESGEKLVVFATHKEIVNEVANEFKCHKIMGETPAIERQKIVEDFQNNPDTKLVVLNIKAGGVGITLTASSNVLFLEYPWTPADLEQAIDRTHRIGQKDSVTAWFLVGKDTIDEEILDMLGIKQSIVSKTVSGEKREKRMLLIPRKT
jgi:SNF2 family DNA or RNA helicase